MPEKKAVNVKKPPTEGKTSKSKDVFFKRSQPQGKVKKS